MPPSAGDHEAVPCAVLYSDQKLFPSGSLKKLPDQFAEPVPLYVGCPPFWSLAVFVISSSVMALLKSSLLVAKV